VEKRLVYSRLILLLTGFAILFNCCAALLASETLKPNDQTDNHFSIQKDSSSSIILGSNDLKVDLEEIETETEEDNETENWISISNDSAIQDWVLLGRKDSSSYAEKSVLASKQPLYLLNEDFRI
jgi:hypothetical protein